jgi:formylmethanofuran dehydrogenase subunit B
MEEKIVERIDLFCEIYQKAYEKASTINPDNARHMASEVFVQVARDLRTERISQLKREENGNNQNSNNGNNGRPATQKQRQALHKFGIQNVPKELTSKEASGVLDMLISLSKERNSDAINKMVEELNAGKEWAIWNTG